MLGYLCLQCSGKHLAVIQQQLLASRDSAFYNCSKVRTSLQAVVGLQFAAVLKWHLLPPVSLFEPCVVVLKATSACQDLFLRGRMRYGPGFVKRAVLCVRDGLDGSGFKKGRKEGHGMKR